MMEVIEISEDELDDFTPLLGKDLTEDVKRAYTNALGVMDDEDNAAGVLVYELLDSESAEDTKARINFVKSDSPEVVKELLDYYKKNKVGDEEIVESFYELDKEKSAKLLEGEGFSFEKKEDICISTTLEELEQTPLGKKKELPDYVGSISSLTPAQFRDTLKQFLFKGYKGILQDIAFLPKNWYDNDISSCVISGGMVQGLFLIRKTPTGKLIPVLYYACGPDKKQYELHMLRYTASKAIDMYPGRTAVIIPRTSDFIRTLTDKLLPGQKGDEIFYGERKEQ